MLVISTFTASSGNRAECVLQPLRAYRRLIGDVEWSRKPSEADEMEFEVWLKGGIAG